MMQACTHAQCTMTAGRHHSKHRRLSYTNKKSQHKVRFVDVIGGDSVIGYSCGSTAMWYSLTELLFFKREAKRISKESLETMRPYEVKAVNPAFLSIRLGREENQSASSLYPSSSLYISPHRSGEDDDRRNTTARGLVYACCYERQKRTVRGRQVLLRLSTRIDSEKWRALQQSATRGPPNWPSNKRGRILAVHTGSFDGGPDTPTADDQVPDMVVAVLDRF